MLRLILKLLYAATSLIEGLIIVRILLSILARNSSHTVIRWVNDTSTMFIAPFEGIVPSVLVIDNLEIALTPLIALVFYAIVGFVLSELVKAFSSN
jgi:hypothetical protein